MYWAAPASCFHIRAGSNLDINFIRLSLLREGMNPLFLEPERFVVAEKGGQGRDNGKLVAFGQVRPVIQDSTKEGGAVELASLFVMPEMRQQGYGTRIVEALLQRPDLREADVFLLTLSGTRSFYERLGFNQIDSGGAGTSLPTTLKAEMVVGGVIASLVAQDRVVCMKRAPS